MREYELQTDAELVFKKHGVCGASYFALIATGPNTFYWHYNKNTATLHDAELVQFDYAPDHKRSGLDLESLVRLGNRVPPYI